MRLTLSIIYVVVFALAWPLFFGMLHGGKKPLTVFEAAFRGLVMARYWPLIAISSVLAALIDIGENFADWLEADNSNR